MVDIATGGVSPGRTILIDEGRILRIETGPTTTSARAATDIDGTGLYAIPGLWDMHVHALWDSTVARSFLPAFARVGITGIRDMGGTLAVLERVRSSSGSETLTWPRIIAAGPILDGPEPVDPSISIALQTPAEARQAVDRLAEAGVEFIKVYTLLPREAFLSVLERAREVGLPVVGHVPAEVTVLEAVEAGLVGIEHLRDELEPMCHQTTPIVCAQLIERFVELGVHNTPTLVVLEAKSLEGYRSSPNAAAVPEIPEIVQESWNTAAATQSSRPGRYFETRRDIFAHEMDLVGRLNEAGAPILAGSDTGNPFIYPGLGLQRELTLLVEAGMTTREALASATLVPAAFLGLADSIGAIRTGHAADVVLLDGNPLEDIANVSRVVAVILRGRPL